jgi:hypothetical protein
VLDTTNMSFDEVVNYVLRLVEERVWEYDRGSSSVYW